MGLIEHRLKDLDQDFRELRGDLDAGKIARPEYLKQKDMLLRYTDKFLTRLLEGIALEIKCNARYKAMKQLVKANITGDGEAIDISFVAIELEKIKCPQQGERIITRSECLEWSGDTNHFDDCNSCDHFAITRQRLLPKGDHDG